jgi:hypothetical protein
MVGVSATALSSTTRTSCVARMECNGIRGFDVPESAALLPGYGLIVRTVPGVREAVKWNSPFYGVEGQGWFLNFHTFANYV